MTKLSGDIRIDAPKERVWAVLADLEAVQLYNPGITKAYYTSEARNGVGATRHCDFPDGGYVKERATEWNPGEGYRLEIYEGTVPFQSSGGSFMVKDTEPGSTVTFTFEYELEPGVPVDPQEVERQNREELIPGVLAGLKHYVETGQPMPMPEGAGAAVVH